MRSVRTREVHQTFLLQMIQTRLSKIQNSNLNETKYRTFTLLCTFLFLNVTLFNKNNCVPNLISHETAKYFNVRFIRRKSKFSRRKHIEQ